MRPKMIQLLTIDWAIYYCRRKKISNKYS